MTVLRNVYAVTYFYIRGCDLFTAEWHLDTNLSAVAVARICTLFEIDSESHRFLLLFEKFVVNFNEDQRRSSELGCASLNHPFKIYP